MTEYLWLRMRRTTVSSVFSALSRGGWLGRIFNTCLDLPLVCDHGRFSHNDTPACMVNYTGYDVSETLVATSVQLPVPGRSIDDVHRSESRAATTAPLTR